MEEIKRGLLSKNFIWALFGTSILLALATKFGKVEGVLGENYHASILLEAMKSNLMVMGIPVLAALPCTTNFVEEMNSGYVKFYLLRTKRKSYVLGKALAAGLGGGLSLMGGAMLNYGIYWLIFAPRQAYAQASMWAEFLKRLTYLGLLGGICGILGALLAAWLMSNYMGYIGPFVIYYFLIMLKERYFTEQYGFYPKEWLAPEHDWGNDNWGLVCFLLLLVFFFMMGCVITMEKRSWDV